MCSRLSGDCGRSVMLEYIAFLSCLEFALLNSVYQDIIMKPKQVLCLESVYMQNDVMCVLPTGYGKSLHMRQVSGLGIWRRVECRALQRYGGNNIKVQSA